MKFAWDINKAVLNVRKHGVSFDQACQVFADPLALTLFDDEHSEDEERWILLGRSSNEVLLLVVHTFADDKGVETVRIISARKATKNEKQAYQKRSRR